MRRDGREHRHGSRGGKNQFHVSLPEKDRLDGDPVGAKVAPAGNEKNQKTRPEVEKCNNARGLGVTKVSPAPLAANFCAQSVQDEKCAAAFQDARRKHSRSRQRVRPLRDRAILKMVLSGMSGRRAPSRTGHL
jgi:hypothetical protein